MPGTREEPRSKLRGIQPPGIDQDEASFGECIPQRFNKTTYLITQEDTFILIWGILTAEEARPWQDY
jgi:hypothetical protein